MQGPSDFSFGPEVVVMACIVMAYVVMAHIVMAYVLVVMCAAGVRVCVHMHSSSPRLSLGSFCAWLQPQMR